MLTFNSVFLDELIRYLSVYSFDETQLFTKSLATRLYSVLESGSKEQRCRILPLLAWPIRSTNSLSAKRKPGQQLAHRRGDQQAIRSCLCSLELKFLRIGLCRCTLHTIVEHQLWTKLSINNVVFVLSISEKL